MSLDTLPHELITLIAENVDRDDLLSLRLAGTKLAACVQDFFIETFVQTRRYLISRHGLRKMRELDSLPHLAEKIREVNLVAIHPEPGYKIGILDGKEKAIREELYMVLSTRGYKAVACAETVAQVADALRAISAAGIEPWLLISHDAMRPWPACGTAYLTNALGFDFTTAWRMTGSSDASRGAKTVLSAIAMADYPVTKPDLFDHFHGQGISQYAFNVPKRFQRALQVCWSRLRMLNMRFGPDAFHNPLQKSAWQSYRSLMPHASALEQLTVSREDWSEFHEPGGKRNCLWFGWFVRCFDGCKLKALTLSGVGAQQQDIEQFLQLHSDSLRSFRLTAVAIRLDDCWHETFCWVAENLRLSDLVLCQLQHGTCNATVLEDSDGKQGQWRQVTGELVVEQSLQDLTCSAVFLNEYEPGLDNDNSSSDGTPPG